MKGFYIEKLVYTGKSVENVTVILKKGVNAIHGPSDTGKTYIFKSIDFMFGKKNPPKTFKEAEGYTTLFMIINIGGNSVITLERDLTDNSKLYVYRCEYEKIMNVTPEKYSVSTNAKKSISNFYMSLLGITSKLYIVENNTTKVTKQFTIRYLIKYFMLNESKMIEEQNPPIYVNNQYNKRVFHKNAFDYLISNKNEIEKVSKSQNDGNRKVENQIELIDSMILENSRRIENKEDICNFDKSDLNSVINSIGNKMSYIQQTIKRLNRDKIILEKDINNQRVKKENLQQTLERFSLLEKQYQNEIDRYQFIYEGNCLIDQLPKRSCPVCDNELNIELVNIDLMYEAMVSESKIISSKQKDLRNSINDLATEIESLGCIIEKEINEADLIEKQIESLTYNELNTLEDEINEYLELEQLGLELDSIRNEQKMLEKKREQLYSKINKSSEVDGQQLINRNMIIDNAKQQLCKKIAKKLKEWIFDKEVEVIMDDDNDLVINGKSRKSFGKGYRSLIHTAYYLSFFDMVNTAGSPRPNLIIFDSPLTAYSDIEQSEEGDIKVSNTTITNFYRNLEQDYKNSQLIIIDNKEIPDNSSAHEIHFTKNEQFGRYGLFPVS